jgi:hypothetical protein
MGSYCSLRFDSWDICDAKSEVPDVFCALFQESDRVTSVTKNECDDDGEGGEELRTIVYQASWEVILDRLALLGYTETVAKERFALWRDLKRQEYKELLSDDDEVRKV